MRWVRADGLLPPGEHVDDVHGVRRGGDGERGAGERGVAASAARTAGAAVSAEIEPKNDLVSNERMDWLRTLCDDWSSEIGAPFELEHDGVRYIGAISRSALVLLRAEEGETTTRRFAPAKEHALKLLDGIPPRSVDLLHLWLWLAALDTRCPGCGGVGFLSEPGLVAFDVDGNGPVQNLWERCTCQNPGFLFGVPIDRRLLIEKLGILTTHDGRVEVIPNIERRAVGVRSSSSSGTAADWIIILMGVVLAENRDPLTVSNYEVRADA